MNYTEGQAEADYSALTLIQIIPFYSCLINMKRHLTNHKYNILLYNVCISTFDVYIWYLHLMTALQNVHCKVAVQ